MILLPCHQQMEVERNWYYIYGMYESKDELQNVIRSISWKTSHNIFVIWFSSSSLLFPVRCFSTFTDRNPTCTSCHESENLNFVRRMTSKLESHEEIMRCGYLITCEWISNLLLFPFFPTGCLRASPLCAAIESSTQQWSKLKWGEEMKLLDGI